jgi:urease accessory protein
VITTTITTTGTRTSQTGRLRLRVERRGGRSALVRAEGHVPYAARLAHGDGDVARVTLVQTVAGPLAGDEIEIEIEVGEGAALELRTNAATLAFPAAVAARQKLRARVEPGGRLAWLPEPLILAAGCNLESSVELELEAGAAALTRELVVLGRHDEKAGRYESELRCELEGRPLLHEAVRIDGTGLGYTSPAILGRARAFISVALLGIAPEEPCGPGELALDGPGRVLRALAPGVPPLRSEVSFAEARYLKALARDDYPSASPSTGEPQREQPLGPRSDR